MRLLALDVSTHTGWALMERSGPDEPIVRLAHGRTDLLTADLRAAEEYPWNYVDIAYANAAGLMGLVEEHREGLDEVVIEETNGGGRAGRYDQKLLEMLHFALLQQLRLTGLPVRYINTGDWRRTLAIRIPKADLKKNAALRRAKKQGTLKETKKALGVRGLTKIKNVAVRWARETYGVDLLEGDDDPAEALALGTARFQGVRLATGTDRKPKQI